MKRTLDSGKANAVKASVIVADVCGAPTNYRKDRRGVTSYYVADHITALSAGEARNRAPAALFEMDVTPLTDAKPPKLVAVEPEPLSLDDPTPMTPAAMPYDSRMERVRI